jgi:predicted adenylyl cyclase CyaB
VESFGARFESKNHIIDYWFCRKESNKFDEVKQDKPGSYGLRIRRTLSDDGEDGEGKENIEINCKVLEREKDHNAFHEHETKVEDFEQARHILESIGFKVFCVVDKKRTAYRLGKCLINIEDIKGFRPAVELEIIDDKDQEKHKACLNDLLGKLGVGKEDLIEKSITFLYMKDFSFK